MRATIIPVVLALASGVVARPPVVLLGYQDTLGQYSFGYSAPDSARSETRSLNGATRGSYSYVDGAGVIQRAEYIADEANGFRVAATNLPQAPEPVEDTPEVAAARAAHLRELARASGIAELPEEPMVDVEEAAKESTVEERDARSTEKPAVEVESIEEAAVPLPLNKVNSELPSFSTHAAAPVIKAASLSQAMPAQETITPGVTTPAEATLKPSKERSPAASMSPLQQEPEDSPAASAVSEKSGRQLEGARFNFASINIIPLGYEPNADSFFRFVAIPYSTYATL